MAETTNRIDRAFADLAAQGRKGLLPYVTAGLPDLDTTEKLLLALADAGATAVELGFPYSDSIADGPTIQTSFTRALAKGIRVRDILDMVARVRRHSEMPLLAMLSYSIVYRMGVADFTSKARNAGIDGLILPDLSLEEAPAVADSITWSGLCLPMLASPASSPTRREQIARVSTGFVYYMSVAGITGERRDLPEDLAGNIRHLRQVSGRPVVCGFGISRAEQVRQVCTVADGAIIGSALVRRIMETADAGGDTDRIVDVATEAVRDWLTGLP